jgi:hypothetical protein
MEREDQIKFSKDIEEMRSANPKEFWRKLKGASEGGNELTDEIINSQGEMVEGQDAMRVWKESFQNIYKKDKGVFDESYCSFIEAQILKIEVQSDDIIMDDNTRHMNRPLDLEEVRVALRNMKGGKATGTDGITIEMLREGEEQCIQALWEVFNAVWLVEEFPDEWTLGVINPIPKGSLVGKAKLIPLNYRGITLLNVVPKLFTSIIHERLRDFCELQGVLSEEQAGFRKFRSTVDQIFILYEVTKGRFPAKTFCCFLDIEKAYDKTWRDGLWYQLAAKGIVGKMWRMLRNMYRRVKSCVKVNSRLTEFFDIFIGLRQGCKLSPLLFDIFIDGLVDEVKRTGKGVRYGDVIIGILVFADDIALLAENRLDLELLIEVVCEYSRKWRFQFGLDKSAVVIFEDNRTLQLFVYKDCKIVCTCGRHWRLGEGFIKEVEVYKYLGIEFNKRCTFSDLKARLADKARKNRAYIGAMTRAKGGLSVKANITHKGAARS